MFGSLHVNRNKKKCIVYQGRSCISNCTMHLQPELIVALLHSSTWFLNCCRYKYCTFESKKWSQFITQTYFSTFSEQLKKLNRPRNFLRLHILTEGLKLIRSSSLGTKPLSPASEVSALPSEPRHTHPNFLQPCIFYSLSSLLFFSLLPTTFKRGIKFWKEGETKDFHRTKKNSFLTALYAASAANTRIQLTGQRTWCTY